MVEAGEVRVEGNRGGDGIDPIEPFVFTWPQIGWKVILLEGVSPPAALNYVNPIIPPPMNARCPSNMSSDKLLFTSRDLRRSGDDDSRCISSVKYNELILDAENVILLDTFRSTIKILHDWKSQLELEREEEEADSESVNDDITAPYIPLGLPHNFTNEAELIALLDSCEKPLHHARTFRSDIVRHLYPNAKVPDKYIHFPLIPRDETTNEGMTLTNAAILNLAGLLKKEDNGKYSLGENAAQRVLFLYGDALTAALHDAIYDRTLCQITQLGNREYIEILLAAHDRIVIQKGQFHQLITARIDLHSILRWFHASYASR